MDKPQIIATIIEDAFDRHTNPTLGGLGPDKTDLRAMIEDSTSKIIKALEAREAIENVEMIAHIKRLRDLMSWHINPYNLGDNGETIKAINRLILFVQQNLIKTNPNG